MNASKADLEKLKELGIILDAIPSTKRELDEVEEEIKKAERYFQLLRQIKELERQVFSMENVVAQLEELPNNLCNADVHPEGKAP